MIADRGFNEDYNPTSETSECAGFEIKIIYLGKESGTYNNWNNWYNVRKEETSKGSEQTPCYSLPVVLLLSR
jgi:hypothetical protein